MVAGVDTHRYSLSNMVMLKDNHIDACGGIATTVCAASMAWGVRSLLAISPPQKGSDGLFSMDSLFFVRDSKEFGASSFHPWRSSHQDADVVFREGIPLYTE